MLGMGLGSGLGKGVNTYFANKALEDTVNDPELQDAPQSKKLGALQRALSPYGELGQEVFQGHLGIAQMEQQEAQQDVLSRISSGEKIPQKMLKKLSPENQFKVQELQKKKQAGKSVYDALVKAGYPEDTAGLWQSQIENSPVGGQSDVIKNVNDLIKRSAAGKGLGAGPQEKVETKPNIEIPGTDLGPLELDFPELPDPVGMTPADMINQNQYREKINIPIYTESVDRLNALDDEYREVRHLQDLDATPGALPTGVQKWNVNWDTGDLRVKALATPEAQDYVKTIARMARRAKDFFPGRVTNFDLDQFKQGFPTLANSPEGRKIIAEQLALGNRIAYLKDETYKAAMDHYGSGADPVLVKKYATENYRRLKSQLEDKLNSVNTKAREVVDKESGSLQDEKPERESLENIWK